MALKVNHWQVEKQGPLSELAMRQLLEAKGYQVNAYVYPPGTCFPEHSHNVDKIDGVLSGRFKMNLYGQSVILQAGDTLAVPKGVIHSAEVLGEEPVISLDAIKF